VASKARKKRTVLLTNRALLDITSIEAYSLEKFGERVALQYISKLEAGISRISDNAEILREEAFFHESLKFYRIEQHLFVCETGIEDKIIILTLLHASMDIPSRLAELEAKLPIEVEMLLKQLDRSNKT
jgi:plasmid stabilization system protein ParE